MSQPSLRLNYVIDGHSRTQYRGYIYLYACYANIAALICYITILLTHEMVLNNLFVAASTCHFIAVAIHCCLCVEYHMLDIRSAKYDASIIQYELYIQKYDYIFAYAINVTSAILLDFMVILKEADTNNLHAVLWVTSIFKVALFIVFVGNLKIPAYNQWNEFIAVGIILSIIDATVTAFLVTYYYCGYLQHGGILLAYLLIIILAIVGTSTHVIGRVLNLNKSPRFNTHDVMHVGIVAAIAVCYVTIVLFIFDKI